MHDEVAHFRGIVHDAETKVKNAWSRIREHENRAKPCEKCATAKRQGYLGCDYYFDQHEGLRKKQYELDRAKRNLRAATDRSKCFITDLGEPLLLVNTTTREEFHLGRYAFWRYDASTNDTNVAEVSDDLQALKKKHGANLRVFAVQEKT